MFLSMLVSLFSVRLAAAVSIALTLAAIYFALHGHGFGYGAAFLNETLTKIALRSGLLSIALLCVSPIGAVELYLKQRRSEPDAEKVDR
jgi:predicted Kef-type K+ transport protein